MEPSKDWLVSKLLTLIFLVFLGVCLIYDRFEKYLPKKDSE